MSSFKANLDVFWCNEDARRCSVATSLVNLCCHYSSVDSAQSADAGPAMEIHCESLISNSFFLQMLGGRLSGSEKAAGNVGENLFREKLLIVPYCGPVFKYGELS